MLHRTDLQQCIDCQLCEGIDLLIFGAFVTEIQCRKATHNHCKTVLVHLKGPSAFRLHSDMSYMCLVFVYNIITVKDYQSCLW